MPIRQFIIFILVLLSACSTNKKLTPSICDDYFKSIKIQTIKGTIPCRSIIIANGIVIRTEEINSDLLQHISILKCQDSYRKYGDIGVNGVIVEDTKQLFDFITPSKIEIVNSPLYIDKKKLYFLNGFRITDDSLKISKNAIKRIEFLKPENYIDTTNNDTAILINIWTLTKKEARKSIRKCSRTYN